MAKITISSNVRSPRLQYVADFIFTESLQISWKSSYSERMKDRFVVTEESSGYTIELPNIGLLAETGVREEWKDRMSKTLTYWSEDPKSILQLDCLALVFFLISRYEEYLPYTPELHGRFPARASCLYHAGLIQIPVVDQIITCLQKALGLPPPKKDRQLVSTIDVDYPWFAKHLKFPYRLAKGRLVTSPDPFDTYREILDAHQDIDVRPRFFLLPGGQSKFEKVQRYRRKPYRKLAEKLDAVADIGIHPPYRTMEENVVLQKSMDDYVELTNQRPTHARQHYLRLKIPYTYQLYLKNGITHDYTMGFADSIGFRAGTARSFYWYDLSSESTTTLRIIPLVAMDVTLRQYQCLSPEATLAQLLKLKALIGRFGGRLGLLWHNSSLSEIDDWLPYREVYFDFLADYGSD